MKDEAKKKLYEVYRVHVAHGCWSPDSKCNTCKDQHDRYMVFVGGSQLSNLHGNFCDQCLPAGIDAAIQYRDNLIDKQIKRHDDQLIEETQKLLRERKLERVIQTPKIINNPL